MNEIKNEIKIFKNPQFGSIRTIMQGSEPWFVGKDVAEALGYAKPQNAIAAHVDDEDKTLAPIQGGCSTGTQNTIIINESGLYSLILSSKLPTAKEFKRWVTSEVLPSIRQTGGYISGQSTMSDADLMAKALLVAQRQIEQREERINALETANKKLLPDAEYGRSLQSKHGITTTSIAKELGMSAVTLNKRLHELGVQYRQSGQWYLYRKYQNKGLTTTRTVPIVRFDGKPDVRRETLWTMAGHRFIRDLMTKTEA